MAQRVRPLSLRGRRGEGEKRREAEGGREREKERARFRRGNATTERNRLAAVVVAFRPERIFSREETSAAFTNSGRRRGRLVRKGKRKRQRERKQLRVRRRELSKVRLCNEIDVGNSGGVPFHWLSACEERMIRSTAVCLGNLVARNAASIPGP